MLGWEVKAEQEKKCVPPTIRVGGRENGDGKELSVYGPPSIPSNYGKWRL